MAAPEEEAPRRRPWLPPIAVLRGVRAPDLLARRRVSAPQDAAKEEGGGGGHAAAEEQRLARPAHAARPPLGHLAVGVGEPRVPCRSSRAAGSEGGAGKHRAARGARPAAEAASSSGRRPAPREEGEAQPRRRRPTSRCSSSCWQQGRRHLRPTAAPPGGAWRAGGCARGATTRRGRAPTHAWQARLAAGELCLSVVQWSTQRGRGEAACAAASGPAPREEEGGGNGGGGGAVARAAAAGGGNAKRAAHSAMAACVALSTS